MPELPEVETTRAGVAPLLEGARVEAFRVRDSRLRWPVSIPEELIGQQLKTVGRRGKYLLFEFEAGTLIVHLGMSGNMRVMPEGEAYLKHDHVEIVFDSDSFPSPRALRLNDARRFGSVHWHTAAERARSPHWLLRRLGPEPLTEEFNGNYLKRLAGKRRVAVKNFIMDSQVVVGVGNIYASEALFLAGIRPTVAANRVTLKAYEWLAESIKEVLSAAISMGGTTLRDFVKQDGSPGYFKQSLQVYGREGLPCACCGQPLSGIRLGQRATVFCKYCQRAQSFKRPTC